ncbi:MAG: COX15/CtaA family protein, partial [Pirellulaceae bacterium]
PLTRRLFLYLKAMVVIQILLGISTLLLHVPVILGALHQGGAIILLTLMLCLLFDGRKTNQNLGE